MNRKEIEKVIELWEQSDNINDCTCGEGQDPDCSMFLSSEIREDRRIIWVCNQMNPHTCLSYYTHGGLVPWTCPKCGQQWTVRESKFVEVPNAS